MTEYQWLKEFSWTLRDLIEETGISQSQLAEESGVGRTNISRYLRAEQLPTITKVLNLAYAMDYEMDEVMEPYDIVE